MRVKKRVWQQEQDDDPAAGLINLFDVWIVVVIALILTLVGSVESNAQLASENSSDPAVQELQSKMSKLDEIQRTESNTSGKGVLLGKAYRLESGEVVYVPE